MDEPDSIGVKFKHLKKEIGYTIQNIPVKKVITSFVVKILLQHAGLAQIVENYKNLNFDSQELCTSWLSEGTLYNPKICLYLHGYSFKTFFKAGRKDRYDIMYDIDAYNKQHPPK